MAVLLNPLDKKILKVLQTDARIPNNQLADKVRSSPSTVLRRVQQLEHEGVIQHYITLLDAVKLGFQLQVFVEVILDKQTKNAVDHFASEIVRFPEVLECHLVLGEYDYLLRLAVADLDTFQKFLLNHLTQIRGVSNVTSRVIVKEVKRSAALPL
jgi:Lrp/AsnC family transcriptional regulator, leucine-responsive regulatory protein